MSKEKYPKGEEVPGSAFVCDCRLTAFLHVLMRDHVPFGVAEDIIKNHLTDGGSVYENKTSAMHANFMAKRILGDK